LSDGLVAIAVDDGIEMAMAKSLAENMDEAADRGWQEAIVERPARRRATSRPPAAST